MPAHSNLSVTLLTRPRGRRLSLPQAPFGKRAFYSSADRWILAIDQALGSLDDRHPCAVVQERDRESGEEAKRLLRDRLLR